MTWRARAVWLSVRGARVGVGLVASWGVGAGVGVVLAVRNYRNIIRA